MRYTLVSIFFLTNKFKKKVAFASIPTQQKILLISLHVVRLFKCPQRINFSIIKRFVKPGYTVVTEM